jgi:hypothetical protein
MAGENETFELLVNGVPRTYRDIREHALDAARILKHRDMSAEITIINRNTREWALLRNIVAEPVWQAPGMPEAKPIGC